MLSRLAPGNHPQIGGQCSPKAVSRMQPKSAGEAGFCTPIAAHRKFQILNGNKDTNRRKQMRRTLNALVRAVTDGAHQAIAVTSLNSRPVDLTEFPPAPFGRRGGDAAQTYLPRRCERSADRGRGTRHPSQPLQWSSAQGDGLAVLQRCAARRPRCSQEMSGPRWKRALFLPDERVSLLRCRIGLDARLGPRDGRRRHHFFHFGQALAHQPAVAVAMGLVLGVCNGFAQRRVGRSPLPVAAIFCVRACTVNSTI